MERKGIDISSYQRGINFDNIKASAEFVILRAGFTGWGTGVSYNKDSCFEDFYNQAKEKMISDNILNGIMEDGQVTFEALI